MKNPKASPKKQENFKYEVKKFYFLKYKKFLLNSPSYFLKHKKKT